KFFEDAQAGTEPARVALPEDAALTGIDEATRAAVAAATRTGNMSTFRCLIHTPLAEETSGTPPPAVWVSDSEILAAPLKNVLSQDRVEPLKLKASCVDARGAVCYGFPDFPRPEDARTQAWG